MKRIMEKIKKAMECCGTRYENGNLVTCSSDCPYFAESNFCRNVLFADIKRYIRFLEENQPIWYNVNNPPKEAGKYIVRTEKGAIYAAPYRTWDDGGFFATTGTVNVTHWTNMPKFTENEDV